MTTTSLYVELLVIGLQVLAWLVLLLVRVFHLGDEELTQAWGQLKDLGLVLVAGAFALAYMLGIIADKLCKLLFQVIPVYEACCKAATRIKCTSLYKSLYKSKEHDAMDETSIGMAYAYVSAHSDQPDAELLYARSKVRILRASILNVPLILLLAFLLLSERTYVDRLSQVIMGAVVLLATALVAIAYSFNEHLYRERVQQVKAALRKMKREEQNLATHHPSG
jgi:hypothetical protein